MDVWRKLGKIDQKGILDEKGITLQGAEAIIHEELKILDR